MAGRRRFGGPLLWLLAALGTLRLVTWALAALLVPAPADSAEAVAPPPEASLLRAPHFDGRAFFNPWERSSRSGWDLLRWQLFSPNPYAEERRREPVIPRVENSGAGLSGTAETPTFTWVGHATFAIHDGHDVVLTDPHFTKRALVPARAVPPGIPVESVPEDAFAVISHSHYDHLDAGSVEALPPSVGWIVPLGLGEWFRERGREDVVELDWWESTRRGRWKITCLPSQHWSRRIGHGTNETLWCAWLLDSGRSRTFFAGDTGYFEGFAEYGRVLPPIDVALLPIGAYAPRWFMAYQHLDPAQALQAFVDLRAEHMIGMHWGTFDLTDEPLDQAPIELAEAVAARGTDPTRVHVLPIGGRFELPSATRRAEAPQDEAFSE